MKKITEDGMRFAVYRPITEKEQEELEKIDPTAYKYRGKGITKRAYVSWDDLTEEEKSAHASYPG